MKNLLILMVVLSMSLNSCFSNLRNVYSYTENYDTLSSFYQALEKDEAMIIWDFVMNPGEVMFTPPTILFHAEKEYILEYRFSIQHAGLSYYNYVSISREESRMSGGQLFRGEYFDEELIYEDLVIRTRFTPESKYNGSMRMDYNFYFKKGEIGFYGEVTHVNEIPENFDKQTIIDYIIELYERHVDGL